MQQRYIETFSGSGLEVLIPRKIGQLEFVSILGVGANAVVYEGRHVSTGQCYACKAFNRENMKDDYQKYLIEQELRASELLQNPHIVSIKDTLYDEKVIVPASTSLLTRNHSPSTVCNGSRSRGNSLRAST